MCVCVAGGELHSSREWEEPRDPGQGAELWHHQPSEGEDPGRHLQKCATLASPKSSRHGPRFELLFFLYKQFTGAINSIKTTAWEIYLDGDVLWSVRPRGNAQCPVNLREKGSGGGCVMSDVSWCSWLCQSNSSLALLYPRWFHGHEM